MADFQAHGEYYPEPKDDGPDPDLVAEQRRQDAIDAARHHQNGGPVRIACSTRGVPVNIGIITVAEREQINSDHEERIWIYWLHHFLRGMK